MYFKSAQSIIVEFSYKNWNTKLKVCFYLEKNQIYLFYLKINSNEIISSNKGMISSFNFRTPSISYPSEEINSLPIDINFSIYFDNLIILKNLIEFNYKSDILLNISSNPIILPYTGEELKLQVENLTEAASIEDIQLFIGCSLCQIKTFTSKGITCQPPNRLINNNQIVLNNQQHQSLFCFFFNKNLLNYLIKSYLFLVDCTKYNSSMGPIRFRLGYREYLIGYLSYSHYSTSKYSISTIIYISFGSCLLTIIFLIFALCLYIKLKKYRKEKNLSSIKTNKENEKVLWSTTTSATTAPYYQVYEQIPSSSSQQNTLTRAPLMICPYHHHHYKQSYSTLSLIKHSSSSLTTISIEHEQLKKLIFTSDYK